jgi:hypothetical protein
VAIWRRRRDAGPSQETEEARRRLAAARRDLAAARADSEKVDEMAERVNEIRSRNRFGPMLAEALRGAR